LEGLVHEARRIPFTASVTLNEDDVMDIVDQLRFNLPEEIKQANWTVSEQQRLIAEAHSEAGRIVSRANEKAEAIVSEQEVLRRAERQAQQVVRDAQNRAEQIVREAEGYALEQLQQLEAHLGRTLATVKRGVEALQPSGAGAPAAAHAGVAGGRPADRDDEDAEPASRAARPGCRWSPGAGRLHASSWDFRR
jgi:vacuolar-type H+-ATPase subunit H